MSTVTQQYTNRHTTVDQLSHNSVAVVTQDGWTMDTYNAKTTGVAGIANVFFTKKLADMKRKAYIC